MNSQCILSNSRVFTFTGLRWQLNARLILGAVIFGFLLFGLHSVSLASSCGLMSLLINKTTAVRILDNECEDEQNLAKGTTIAVYPGSRLWLKSQSQALYASDFQIICQNPSTDSVHVSISGRFPPWFRVALEEQCGSWVDNKLTCYEQVSNKKSFFCAISYSKKKNAGGDAYGRSASVKIRSLNAAKHESTDVKMEQFNIDDIQHDISLCKQLYGIPGPIRVQWEIVPDGLKHRTNILKTNGYNSDFNDCVYDVLESYPYNNLRETLVMESTF